MNDNERERYERAKAQVGRVRGFYRHATVYVLVGIALLAINLITNPHSLWFYWPLLAWGIGLAVHAFTVFGPAALWVKTGRTGRSGNRLAPCAGAIQARSQQPLPLTVDGGAMRLVVDRDAGLGTALDTVTLRYRRRSRSTTTLCQRGQLRRRKPRSCEG